MGGDPFQSNFSATKGTSQKLQLLTQCLKNTSQVYSRTTETRYVFFSISMFVISVTMGMNE